jgi:putative addiction module component (TIGR02574 family)
MASKIKELYEKAMRLDEEERQKLVRLLEEADDCRDSKDEIERNWNNEASRRYKDYKDGKVDGIPADEVFRRLEDRFER